MKEPRIQMKGCAVSASSRTYSYEVVDPSGDARGFTVEVSLELFNTSPIKFQDGPLISRERLLEALAAETEDSRADARLDVLEPDIRGYMERHYPPKARSWNHFKPTAANE
jgi:hypothetical protein